MPATRRAVPLGSLPTDDVVRVVVTIGTHAVRRQLATHGVRPGTVVRVLRGGGPGHGGMIVRCGDTRLALGPGEAAAIIVEPAMRAG